MKKRIKKFNTLIFLGFMLISMLSHGQEASKVSLVNTGEIYVSGDNSVAIYVSGGIRIKDDVSPVKIIQEGITKLSGNFYQDSNGHVFKTNDLNYGTSNGTICFFDPSGGSDLSEKQITSTNLASFNRQGNYVAFPKVKIDMDKNLILPSRMAADMDKLEVETSRTGKLWLKSGNDGSSSPGRIYDASLRFPKRTAGETDNTTTQSTNAPLGKIIVERDINGYRGNTTSEGVMFPFATPFHNTQRSGYFAGNWIRRPVSDIGHHTEYPYGDKIDTGKPGNVIARDQYVTDPVETLKTGQGYLIKPLGTSEFDNLLTNFSEFGLQITGDGSPNPELYKKTLFVFDGSVYNLPKTDEQLNLLPVFDDRLTGDPNKTVNVLIGNSYTSAIDLKKLSQYMLSLPNLYFNRYIQIYVPGSSSYIPYDIYQHDGSGIQGAASLLPNHDIPAMGVFMLRLAKRNSSDPVRIDRTFLTHGANAHNLRSTENYDNEVLFTLTYENRPLAYDLAVIGIRKKAKEIYEALDMPKMTTQEVNSPQLYSLSSDNEKLASNSIPGATQSVRICIDPNKTEGENCTLQFSRQESMRTELLILEDRITGTLTDLYQNDSYTFTVKPQDAKERFVLHFSPWEGTGTTELEAIVLKMYYNKENQSLEISNITEKDRNSKVIITDMQGQTLTRNEMESSIMVSHLPKGVYIAKITGERSEVLKFVR